MNTVIRRSVIKYFCNTPTKLFRCHCTAMDEEDEIYYSNEKLQTMLKESSDKTATFTKYFQNVKYPPVKDFKKGLEWFNVSEPLSFNKHLKGKIVLLDFFTYCCINCMHILPDLKEIEEEFSVEDGLVVIGVHCAKFENEKQSSNIIAAVQRYNINHPVVNDCNSEMWANCDIHAWPTLLLLGPNANPLIMLSGEGHKSKLLLYIKHALKYYKENNLISNHSLPVKPAYHLLSKIKGPFLFPGKITNILDENNHEILAVSDSGNNRIVILKNDGTILKIIGGSRCGFKDGNLTVAEFNNPQGLVFYDKDILFVADTDNHAIRKIDLKNDCVETVAGTGEQGHDRIGGKLWKKQPISSPWDVAFYKDKNVLLIAMAGNHQIWALFLEDTEWWKSKKYVAGSCVSIAGSGREENRNNQYPQSAAFAQPSGLALSIKNKEVYIADSESSSVRKISLVDGKVEAVVGGDRNPCNLFAFGDKDGTLYDAKLQHSLGLALGKDEKVLYVADTYNHKLKKIDIANKIVKTLSTPKSKDTTDGTAFTFNEPAGLCVSADGTKLYLADTNNHFIKVINLKDEIIIENVDVLEVKPKCRTKYDKISTKPVILSMNGGKIDVKIKMNFENGLGLTKDANQVWTVEVPDPSWICNPRSGVDVDNIAFSTIVPDGEKDREIKVIFNLITCTTEKCFMKNFIVEVPVSCVNNGLNNVNVQVNVELDPNSNKIK